MPCTNPGQMISPVTSNANDRDGTTSCCEFSLDVDGTAAPKTRPMADRFCFFGDPHFLFDVNEMNNFFCYKIIKCETLVLVYSIK